MSFLQVINGTKTGQEYELTTGKYIMGRHPECDIVVDTGSVSRHHAQILSQNDQVAIEDLQSRNGTYLNGQLLKKTETLSTGDMIQICDITFRYIDRTSTAATLDDPLRFSGPFQPFIVEDDSSSSTIMSKVNVSTSQQGNAHVSMNPQGKLRALIEINKSLGNALSLDEVLPKVLDSLFNIFAQADRGFIVLKDPQGNFIPRWTKLRPTVDDVNLRVSRTIVQQVMDSKEAILSADAATDVRFELSQSITDFQIRSLMCAPFLDSDGESCGVLQIDTLDQRKRFQSDDLEVLAGVTAQAGVAIVNAQLHEAALQNRAIERDLEVAQKVQQGFLPKQPPQVSGYWFYNYYRAAYHVGGDYFDYIPLPDGRVAVVVADVVGHGVAAALLMAKLSAEVRIALVSSSPLTIAIQRLNETLCQENAGDRFITLVLAILEPETHRVTVVNAGHMPPLIYRSNIKVEDFGDKQVGLPLGIDDSFSYEPITTNLELGNLLAMYTDGINEAMDESGKQYGIQRIRDHIAMAQDPKLAGSNIIDDVRIHVGDQSQNDDMCLVSFGRE